MTRVLVLRPEPGAGETLKRAQDRGLSAVSVPLFEIEPIEWQTPEAAAFDALLITSANAIRAGGEQLKQLRGLPVHAVGKATGEAAKHAGFDIASTGESGVERLLQSIEPDLKLLHVCGEDRKAPDGAKQQITPLIVYRARKVDEPDLAKSDSGVALVHSPRAGRRFGELADKKSLDRGRIAIAAISHAALDACGSGWAEGAAAEKPDDEALLALAATLCNKLQQQ